MRHVPLLLLVAPLMTGCAAEVMEGEEIGEAASASAIENAMDPNGLYPNGLYPNGLYPNGLYPNALTPAALSGGSMDSLQDPGEAGRLSRLFMKYAVSCAFDKSHSFTVSWTHQGVARTETYWGSLGLATEWQSGPLSEEGQEWVTACIGARTNYYGVSVMISLRNTDADRPLGADVTERSGYPYLEGAFWGNVFQPTPELYSCYNPGVADRARAKMRVCASGTGGADPSFCPNIQSVGSCSACCPLDIDPGKATRPVGPARG